MQPGLSSQSQLLDSLKVYLNNKSRLQPIIGLKSILECVKEGTQSRETLFFCEVCVCRLSKADMRNHICGSLHRFNYIKTWHPHLVSEWEETSDLSKMAWTLMEMAQNLEREEGPGDIQLLEVEDAVYQKMATYKENDAVILINSLRDGWCEPENLSEVTSLHCPVKAERTVLFTQYQQRGDGRKPVDIPPDCVKNIPPSQLNGILMDPEPSVSSQNHHSTYLDTYTGSKPLVGLSRVVECKSQDGCLYCFLCHCCRIRINKKDIMDHLTSSSHINNYLLETCPEVMMPDVDDGCLLLAKKVEQEEGRGELKVVNAPESLCILLTGKSYHWCVKMLCSGWTSTNNQKKRNAITEPNMNETSVGCVLEQCADMPLKQAQKAKRRKRKQTNTVFSVSLPLTKGAVVLERTSFSEDSLPVTPSFNPSPSPEAQTGFSGLDRDSEFGKTSQLHGDCHNGAGEFTSDSNLSITLFQDGYNTEDVHFNQSGDQIRDHELNDSQGSRNMFQKQWTNEYAQTQNEGLSPPASHNQDWTSYTPFYRHGAGPEQWNSSTSVEISRAEPRPNYMTSSATQFTHQHQPQNQRRDFHNTSLPFGGAGHLDICAEVDVYRRNAQTCPTHHRSIEPDTREQSHGVQPAPFQACQVGPGWMCNTNHTPGSCVGQGLYYWTNPNQHFPYPPSSSSWSVTQPNASFQAGQALFYEANSDLNFRATGWAGLTM